MQQTFFEFDDPRLPTDVVTIEQAMTKTDNDILEEGLLEAFKNGYFLADVHDWGYTLEKLETDQ